MSDLTAASVQARADAERRATSRVADAKSFMSGLLFIAFVALAGTFLLAVALVVGVVGSPIIAAVVAWVVVHHRRVARERACAGSPATS